MKKILLCCLSLSLCLFLAACDTIVTSERGDKQPQQDATPPPSAATQIQQLTAGDAGALHTDGRCEVEITPDLRAAFFDLAQQDRLDFMPAKDYEADQALNEKPISIEELDDYLYWVLAQAIIWESYGNIDHEQTPEKLSAAYVHDFLQTRCGLDTPTPKPGHIFKLDFDGEYYYYPATSWAEAPVWELANLTLERDKSFTVLICWPIIILEIPLSIPQIMFGKLSPTPRKCQNHLPLQTSMIFTSPLVKKAKSSI